MTVGTPVLWEGDITIRDALGDWFTERPLQGSPRSFSIDPKLTISLLWSNYGYRVDWTNYLNEHLLINTNMVSEALDTLNLLFPHSDESTKSYLDRHGQPFYKRGLCCRERDLDLRSYRHWGRQIQELLLVLNGPRSGLRQLLPGKDQPNLAESANFWIAVFVAGLTVISFVFGLMSVVYAKWAFDYLLSLAQACLDSQEAQLLPEFCIAEG
ncbi:hypothetical protein LY76DRAFT_688147 [Colletotrichum caudatum]|nr:hypothetical protein LY76DRAFT_688147 [Colletotrichum caudatum]